MALAILAGCVSGLAGCKALEDHKCPLFDSKSDHKFGSCLFGKNDTVSKGTKKEETDAIARASLGPSRKEAWEPTEEEIENAKQKGVDLTQYTWSTQRPNGGALFPKSWDAPGPALVVAPDSIAAPVGSEVIVVASYIGEDSQYLRVGEKLTWDVSGGGRFVESNPNENGGPGIFNGEYQGCLDCKLLKKTKSVNSNSMTTTTSSQLWRITRGTPTKLDDVTVLRGQSWTSVTSADEGTSNVIVMSDSIGNWDKRRAVAEIHWVDAAFKFPESSIGMVNTNAELNTSVVRLTTAEPREGWTVRYEVLGGDARLGADQTRKLDVTTDASGNAKVVMSQLRGAAGTAKIKASVIRPKSDKYKQVVVDSKTFFYTWTNVAPVTISLHSMQAQYQQGEEVDYQLTVNNLSDFAQNVVFELVIPRNARLISAEKGKPWEYDSPDKSLVRWHVIGVEPHKPYSVSFVVESLDGSPIELNARIVGSTPVGVAGSAQTVGQKTGSSVVPRAESGSPDPASVAPAL